MEYSGRLTWVRDYSSRKSSAALPHVPGVAGGGDGPNAIQMQVTLYLYFLYAMYYLDKTSYSSRKSSATLSHIPGVAGGGDGRNAIQVQVTFFL